MWNPIVRRISKRWEEVWETKEDKYLREEKNNLELMKLKQQKDDLVELEKLKLELKSADSTKSLEHLQVKMQLIHNSLTVVTNVVIETDIKNENTNIVNINNENANTNTNSNKSSSKSNAKARADDTNFFIGG